MEQQLIQFGDSQQTMSSLEIAEATGKQHKHVMEAIRKMEPAWEKIHGSNFRLMSREIVAGNGAKRNVPCYELTKTECLYIATKFNDEARAKLILRWEALETGAAQPATQPAPKTNAEMLLMYAQQMVEQERRVNAIEQRLDKMEEERKENGRLLLETKVSENSVPAMSLRKSIIALVNEYSAATNTPQQDVWHAVYKDLYYKYNKSINNYTKLFTRETKLDIAERKGLLQPIFDIISDMIVKWRESQK